MGTCQDGEYINSNNECSPCIEGLYCYNNTGRICKSGFYCPTYYKELEGNSAYFCLEGSVEEIPCVLGKLTCPKMGSTKQIPFVAGVFYAIILFNFINIIFYLIKIYYDYKNLTFEARYNNQKFSSIHTSFTKMDYT